MDSDELGGDGGGKIAYIFEENMDDGYEQDITA